jgi:hypothetical protein
MQKALQHIHGGWRLWLVKIPSILGTPDLGNWGKRKRRGRGPDLTPYPQRRSTKATGFRSPKGRRRSAHLLFLGSDAGQGQLAGGGYGCKGAGRSCAAGQRATGRPAEARAGRRTEGRAEHGDGNAGGMQRWGCYILAAHAAQERRAGSRRWEAESASEAALGRAPR